MVVMMAKNNLNYNQENEGETPLKLIIPTHTRSDNMRGLSIQRSKPFNAMGKSGVSCNCLRILK